MNKIIRRLLVLLFLVMLTATASAVTKPPSEGDLLPEFVLTVPQISDQQKYLGLSSETTFTIPQIKANV
ncbi:MAG: hypothetical protein WBI57_10640, partial [Desulfobacterales bacterium]